MKKSVSALLQVLGLIIALVVLFFAFDNYLYDKIDSRIKDPDYIEKLSKTLRPFLIFDQNEIVIYDHGAMTYVDSISVRAINPTHLTQIRLYANSYLQLAPLIESLGPHIYEFHPKRGKGNIWIYDLAEPGFHSGSKTPERFRLEILK